MPNGSPDGGEDAIPDRPGTSMSVSDQHGLGEESMMSFFRAHMTSILQPFAENVEELHKTVYSITGSIRDMMVKIEASSASISEHAAIFPGLRETIEKTHELANNTESMLSKNITDTRALEAAHKASDDRITTLTHKIPPLKQDIQGISQELADARRDIATCQMDQDKNRSGLVKINATGERLSSELSALQAAHERAVEKMNQNKDLFDKHVSDFAAMPNQMKEMRAKLDIFNQNFESRFKRADEKFGEIQKQLVHDRQEFHHLHDAAVKMLCGRLDAHDVNKEDSWQKLKRIEVNLAEQNARIVDNGENFNKLVRLMEQRHTERMDELQRTQELTQLDTRENARSTKSLHDIIHGRSSENQGEIKHWLHHLQEDVDFSHKRSRRLERVMGLEELTMQNQDDGEGAVLKGGILLTDKQIAEFKATFDAYDTDRSGHISIDEVGDLLKSMNHHPPADILKRILTEIDADRSGAICFDEFCTLMSKMLGPDGKVDMEAGLSNLSAAAAREAQLERLFEIVPGIQKELKDTSGELLQEQLKTEKLNRESDQKIKSILGEVEKLKKGLELTQEYWKGFSRGLKETKKTVRQEGAGEMLPSANRLRNLPPLGMDRPTTR